MDVLTIWVTHVVRRIVLRMNAPDSVEPLTRNVVCPPYDLYRLFRREPELLADAHQL